MKKWTYYVAPVALSLAMLTGCIENDEPQGITDLRGAKAEFIRAKTQFELASVEIQKVKIDREKAALAYDNVLLKLKEMDVDLKQIDIDLKNITLEAERAKLENTKAQLLAGREEMLGNHAITMTQIKENAARAEASYQKALVDIQLATLLYKDEQFNVEINNLTGQLEGTREMLNGANDDLLTANSALADYVVEAAYYEKKLHANIDKQKALIAAKTELLEQLEAIEPVSVQDWTAQIKEIDAELAATDKEASGLKFKINEKRSTIAPVNNRIQLQQDLLTKADKTYAFPVADAALQNDLHAYLGNSGIPGFDASFEYIPGSNGEYKMVSDLTVENISLNGLDNPVKWTVNAIKGNFTSGFNQAYTNMFGTSLDYDVYNQWYIITEAAMAKAKAEIAKMELYTSEKKKEYAADEEAWADAYIAYFGALKAYGYNPGLHNGAMGYDPAEKTVYETAEAALEAYNEIEGTPTAAQRTALKTTLEDYYTKRKALDGTCYTRTIDQEPVDFYTLFDDADAMPDATFDHIVIAVGGEGNSMQTLLGGRVVSTASSPSNEGAISVLIAASNAAFGTSLYDFKTIVVPAFENNVISKENLVLPAGIPVNNQGSYAAYLDAYESLRAFKNIDKWNAYYDGLYAAYTVLSDQKDAVDKEIKDLRASVADVNEEIYAMEYELSKLVYDESGMYWTQGNWYPRLNSNQTRNAILSDLKSQLERIVTGTLNAQAQIKVLVYENGTWQYKYLSVPDAITSLKETIAEMEEDLANEENKLEQYKANGEVRDDFGNKEYRATLETEIANCKKTVAMYEDRMTALNATLQALLNAYAGK